MPVLPSPINLPIGLPLRSALHGWALLVGAAVSLGACASDPAPATGGGTAAADTAQSQTDASTGADTTAAIDTGPPAKVSKEEFSVAVSALGVNSAAIGAVVRPDACTDASPCPLVVLIGDRSQAPYPKYVSGAEKLAGALKVGFVIVNLPGTGEAQYIAGEKTDDDIGGPLHQAAVKNVMNLKSKAAWVDPTRLGFVAIGTGLAPVVKSLKLYDALKTVAFVIDVEGPIDRCAYSQAAADPDKQIGPDDGPGATNSTCHITDKAPHSAMYPPAKDGKPASIVCSLGAWPISKTGKDCADNAWWTDREPYTYLKDAFYRYQRIQFRYDHALPSYWSSRKAIEALSGSKAKYFQLNNMPACAAPLSDDDCVGQPCWLQGAYGNGLIATPYTGADFVQITPDGLLTQVLGGYIARMLDTKGSPNCN